MRFRRRRSNLVARVNEYINPREVRLVPIVRDGVTIGWKRAA